MTKFIRPHKHLATWWQLHHETHFTCDLKPGALEYFSDVYNQELMRNYTWLPIISGLIINAFNI